MSFLDLCMYNFLSNGIAALARFCFPASRKWVPFLLPGLFSLVFFSFLLLCPKSHRNLFSSLGQCHSWPWFPSQELMLGPIPFGRGGPIGHNPSVIVLHARNLRGTRELETRSLCCCQKTGKGQAISQDHLATQDGMWYARETHQTASTVGARERRPQGRLPENRNVGPLS